MRGALSIFCCATLLAWHARTEEVLFAQTPKVQTEQVDIKTKDLAAYRQLAYRVFDKIVALKGRYPHLASIKSESRREEAQHKFWIAYHYTHNESWVPNPDYWPTLKCSKMLKSFSPADGLEFNLYFYEGEWPGQALVMPFNIGDIKIVSFVDGSETRRLAALHKDIQHILEDERARQSR